MDDDTNEVEATSERLFERAPDSCLVTDRAGRVLAANALARSVLGPLRSEPPIETLFTADDAAPLLRSLRAIVKGERCAADLHLTLRATGGERPVWARAAPSEWGDQPEPVVLWILRDVGALEESQRELVRSTALKGAYLLALAHDLRTPVAVLHSIVELLRLKADDAAQVRGLSEVLSQGVQKVDHIITDLLDIERLEQDRVEVVRRPTDLGDLVARCVEASQLMAVDVDVRVPVASVDARLVERILVNLLANAHQHGPVGGLVRVRVEPYEPGLRLTVADEGPGIPERAKEAVFDLFHQLGTGGTGVGVGLFLVRRFAMLHGGGASVTDALGGGTCFRVDLAT